MLAYLRRPIPRILWVDAICINQASAVEKASQIPQMGRIYQGATRVVVYLNDGGAGASGGYPPRYNISQIGKPRLERMLVHRYFTRLWVIQELVLAWQVVFAFDGAEWRVDRQAVAQLGLKGWIASIAQGQVSGEGLIGALRVTEASEATDVRDKVFGILGLVGNGEAAGLIPDYRLSAVEVFTGLFAHCVMNLGRVADVLENAAGARAWAKWPSWMPDWRAGGAMTSLNNSTSSLERSKFWNEIYRAAEALGIPAGPEWVPSVVVDANARCSLHPLRKPSVDAAGALSLYMKRFCRIRSRVVYLGCFLDQTMVFKSWNPGGRSLHVFLVRGSSSLILLAACDYSAGIQISLGDEVFFRDANQPLVMRRTSNGARNHFSIVTVLHSVCLVARKADHKNLFRDSLSIGPLSEVHAFHSLEKCFPRFSVEYELVDPYVEQVLPELARFRETPTALMLQRRIFPGATESKQTLAALVEIVRSYSLSAMKDVSAHDPSPFLHEYESLNIRFLGNGRSPGLKPGQLFSSHVMAKYVHFRFPAESRAYVDKWYLNPVDLGQTGRRVAPYQLSLPIWEWNNDFNWIPISHTPGNADEKKAIDEVFARTGKLELRSRFIDIVTWLRDCWWETEVLKRLTVASMRQSEKRVTELDVLNHGRQKTTKRIKKQFKTEFWPQKALEEHDIDGIPCWVTII
ncbi:hypothetical protein OQA88_8736 [Cercophora sp. LCS_1]